MKTERKINASHPHHTNLAGRRGGSLPKVNNDMVSACADVVAKNRADALKLKQNLVNPVSRLKQ